MRNNIVLTDTFRSVAIVGCGSIAGDIDDDPQKRHIYTHAKAISRIKNLKLNACCDSNRERLMAFAEKRMIPGQYLDLQEMLRREQIDILVIATPTDMHYDNVSVALSSNVPIIFCEKPLTFDCKSGLELVERARGLNKLLVVNYMRRWDKFYAECKTLLESQELGRVETIVAYVDTALYMNSIHMLDMLIYFGGDVLSCVGFIDKYNAPRVVHGKEDFGGVAFFKHKNGIASFIKATGESRKNHFFELDIQCTKGRLRILDDDMKYEVYKFEESPQHKGLDELALAYTKYNDHQSERVVDAYLDILDCIEQGREPAFTASESLRSVELVNMIYKSDSIGGLTVYSEL